MIDARTFDKEAVSDTTEIRIPVYEAYQACFSNHLIDPEHFGEKETLQMQLEKLEREADRAEKDGKSKEALKFHRCTFQGYLLLDTRDGAKEAIRLGEKCLENEKLEEQEIKRIRAGMAACSIRAETSESVLDFLLVKNSTS